jgi:general secretion pathway protein I
MKPELEFTPHPNPLPMGEGTGGHWPSSRRRPGSSEFNDVLDSGMHRNDRAAGFTLLEVMMALSIVSIALVAIIGLMGNYVRNLQGLQEQTFAHWVAMNRVVELQLADAWSETAKVKKGEDKTSLFTMRWIQSPSETPFEQMRKVEIEVFDQQGNDSLTRLTTYVGRESRW